MDEETLWHSAQKKDLKTQTQIYIAMLAKITDSKVNHSLRKFELTLYQSYAYQVLEKLDSKSHIDLFTGLIMHSSPVLRELAISHIRRAVHRPVIPKLIERAQRDKVFSVRRAALYSLNWLEAQEAIPALTTLALHEKHEWIREYARETLIKLKATAACPAIVAQYQQQWTRSPAHLKMLETTVQLKCPNAVETVLDYFKSGKIDQLDAVTADRLIEVAGLSRSPLLEPYLIARAKKGGSYNIYILTILVSGGIQALDYLESHLIPVTQSDIPYMEKRHFLKEILHLNKPQWDQKIVRLLELRLNAETRSIVYAVMEEVLRGRDHLKRRAAFNDFLLTRLSHPEDIVHKSELSTMLQDTLQPQHQKMLKDIMTQQQNGDFICNLLEFYLKFATKADVAYIQSFDNSRYQPPCRHRVIKFLGQHMTPEINEYLVKGSQGYNDPHGWLRGSYAEALSPYPSEYTRNLLLVLLKSDRDGGAERAIAAKGLVHQASTDWEAIHAAFIKEDSKEIKLNLLYVIAKYQNESAINLLVEHLEYSDYSAVAKKLLLSKGHSESDIEKMRTQTTKK